MGPGVAGLCGQPGPTELPGSCLGRSRAGAQAAQGTTGPGCEFLGSLFPLQDQGEHFLPGHPGPLSVTEPSFSRNCWRKT